MSDYVLDSSIVLALINDEPGRETAEEILKSGSFAISVVNFSEVVAKLREKGLDESSVEDIVNEFGFDVVDFTYAQSLDAGFLRPLTMHRGLSLGDRACLALAREMRIPALTADRQWRDVSVGIDVHVIR